MKKNGKRRKLKALEIIDIEILAIAHVFCRKLQKFY